MPRFKRELIWFLELGSWNLPKLFWFRNTAGCGNIAQHKAVSRALVANIYLFANQGTVVAAGVNIDGVSLYRNHILALFGIIRVL